MTAPKSTLPRDAVRLCAQGHFNCFCDVKSLHVFGNAYRLATFAEIRDAYEAIICGQHPDFEPMPTQTSAPELPL